MTPHPLPCLLFGLALAGTAASQIERPIPYPLAKPTGWEAAVAAGTRTERGEPGPAYWTNYAHYSIDAELDPATAKVKGHVEITYENRSPNEIPRLSLHLRQNLHKAGSTRNRYVEVTGGVTTSNIRVNGAALPEPVARGQRGRGGRGQGQRGVREAGGERGARGQAGQRRGGNRRGGFRGGFGGPGARVQGTVMTLGLPEPVPSGGEVKVSMDWEYQVPQRGAPRNGHDDFHTYYLGYWYPQMAVYDDVAGGFVADQYLSNAEFYMGYADYDVRFTAPKGWLVRATGTLENPDDVLTRTAQDRLARARGREIVHVLTQDDLDAKRVTRMDHGDELTWHYTAKDVRDCAVSVSDRYVWDATHAVIPNRDGAGKDGIAMIHAVYRPDGRSFDRAAEHARHTIEFMSRTVYPYQWPHMTVCGGVIGGGMEFPMMTICGSGSLGLVAHELGHMWFPMLVGSNEKAHAWQDEGFTSYFTTLTSAAFNDQEPDARRTVQSYVRTAARGEAAPMMTHGDYYPGGGRGGYSFASYGKCAAILAQLRDLVGDDVFFGTFRKYASDWAFKHPYPQDFFNAFSTGAGRNLDWFFREWFFDTWTLDQAIDSVTENDGATEVVVSDQRYATYPTVVEVTYDSGETERKTIDVAHWLSGKKTKTVKFGPNVRKVELNPGKVTLDLSARNDVWERK